LSKLIQSIPGIGPVIASALVTATNGMKDFETDNQLAKYVGVNPIRNDSGKIKGSQKIHRKDNKRDPCITMVL
jgi:transposase